jgi:hypothetical protein|tara:strand:+ start:123 stop:797 length:675 start_codon:yes stop_codon:yes gene_type:complete
MPTPYFRQLPNFEYINRLKDSTEISSYLPVKNLFKRFVINPDYFEDINFATKYKIVGDERPDNIAQKIYGDPTLDWIVLIANNIINVETEWPLSQSAFHNFLLDKYGSEGQLEEIHHYETKQVKNTRGQEVVPAGLEVSEDYSITYFDSGTQNRQVTATAITSAVSNLTYETRLQDKRRNIYLIKPSYVQNIVQDIFDQNQYEEGSTQYINENLVKGDNIRLYT